MKNLRKLTINKMKECNINDILISIYHLFWPLVMFMQTGPQISTDCNRGPIFKPQFDCKVTSSQKQRYAHAHYLTLGVDYHQLRATVKVYYLQEPDQALGVNFISYLLNKLLCLIKIVLSHRMCLYQVMMTLHFLNEVANEAESYKNRKLCHNR